MVKYELILLGIFIGWAFPLNELFHMVEGLIKNRFKFVNEDWKKIVKSYPPKRAWSIIKESLTPKKVDPQVKVAMAAMKKARKKKPKSPLKKVSKRPAKKVAKKVAKKTPTKPKLPDEPPQFLQPTK